MKSIWERFRTGECSIKITKEAGEMILKDWENIPRKSQLTLSQKKTEIAHNKYPHLCGLMTIIREETVKNERMPEVQDTLHSSDVGSVGDTRNTKMS